MIQPHHAELAAALALILAIAACVVSASWRAIKRQWATVRWTPKVAEDIVAEAIVVMHRSGHTESLWAKSIPDSNFSAVFTAMTARWIADGQAMGVHLDSTFEQWRIVETPTGLVCVVPLVRPSPPQMREATNEEERVMHGETR